MDWKRRLELICGLLTSALGISVTVGLLYVTKLTGEMLREPPPMIRTLLFSLLLYFFPSSLVAVGGYMHAVRRQSWGRLLVITASSFLTILFFLSLIGLVWSRWVLLSWLIVLLTGFAIVTSIMSFVVGRESLTFKNSFPAKEEEV